MNEGMKTAPSASPELQSWSEAAATSSRLSSDPTGYHGGGQGRPPSRRGDPLGAGDPEVGLVADLFIRGLGLSSIGLSAVAGIWLHRLLHGGTPANPTIGQYLLATLTFVAASLGSGLLILGRHIHDRIEVAERWRRRW